ncbi:HU family DNA-binding protein [Aeoliella mucimassa]|uniref:Bacterial DNA-binding protein n=1 Tax=Aeoliella mucimassa TaxID=2527972 RepID=A0A518AJ02_9BACT|nr:HU family DNA-binding protein [Aeoliella mucimassa]QDU54707.1 Bacterial DNA-binding protein [Aeoliella mucimassa]
MSPKELTDQLASRTGIDTASVEKVLNALAAAAREGAAEGFLLPGLGRLQIIPGKVRKGINPFTGEETTLHAPAEVEFTLDPQAKQAMLDAWDPTQASDDSVTEPLPRVRLRPDLEDSILADAGVDASQNTNCQLGGTPDWIQQPEVPTCCSREMVFYGQLDSIGGPFMLLDVGMIYVFYCEQCYSTRSVLQFH